MSEKVFLSTMAGLCAGCRLSAGYINVVHSPPINPNAMLSDAHETDVPQDVEKVMKLKAGGGLLCVAV